MKNKRALKLTALLFHENKNSEGAERYIQNFCENPLFLPPVAR